MHNRRIILVLAGLFGVCGLALAFLHSLPQPTTRRHESAAQSKPYRQNTGNIKKIASFQRTPGKGNTVDCHYKWQSFKQNRAADLQLARGQQLAGRDYKRAPNGPTHEIRISIDLDQKEDAKHSFGAPAHIKKRHLLENRKDPSKHEELISNLSERGIRVVYDNVDQPNFEIDYAWGIAQSKRTVETVAQLIEPLVSQQSYDPQRRLMAAIASFVQSLKFKEPPSFYKKGNKKFKTSGLTMPLETLYEGHGDCDTKAVLFATLMAQLAPTTHIIFLKQLQGDARHMLVGVRGKPLRNDQKVTIQGAHYIVLEMNHPWPVGQIPRKHARGIQRFTHETVYPN